MSDPEDEFHTISVRFVDSLRHHSIPSSIGPPFLLEVAKSVEQRGTQAAKLLVNAIEEYGIELAGSLGDRPWRLSGEYASLRVLGANRTLDLLHYASATLLGCTHVASWDRAHFNDRVEKRVNRANASKDLASLKVGNPVAIARYLGIE